MATLAWAAPVANNIRPTKATTKERMFYLWPPGLDYYALTAAPLSVPRINMHGMRLWFQRPVSRSLMHSRAQTRRRQDLIRRGARILRQQQPGLPGSNSPPPRNLFAVSALQNPALSARSQPSFKEFR